MYVVVSKWEFVPGRESDFDTIGRKLRNELKTWPGVESVMSVNTGTGEIAVVGYTDEETYKKLISDPNGPFETSLAQYDVDSIAKWVWSERGEAAND